MTGYEPPWRFARRLSRRDALLSLSAASLAPVSACAARPNGEFTSINGDRQWLAVMGKPASGPIVLVLHGGPGASETVLFRHFNRALESAVRVAYWDQRGAGRSFDPEHPPANMTVAQFVADLGVVVDRLRERFRSPVVLLGHSWGSALGMLYVAERPRSVRGFIGVAQVADQGAQELASFRWAMAEAHRRRNARAVEQLEATGEPPFDVPELMIKNRWVEAFGGYFVSGFSKARTLASALLQGETSVAEVWRIIEANRFSLRAMWPEVRTLNVPARVPHIEVPVRFLLGRDDQQCPSALAAEYIERLTAPSKELLWFNRSAHNPPFEEPSAFNAAVLRAVQHWTL